MNRHRRGRPPWWPDDEPFPPRGRPPWAHPGRGRFLGRFLVFVVVAAALAGVAASTAAWLWRDLLLRPAGGAVLVLAIAALAALGLRGARRVIAPLGDLVDAAGRIEAGDYDARVRERGPRDVRTLARAFNSMSARLAGSETARRTFLADVAHELRTPLAVIRGQAEGIADGIYTADAEHLAPIMEATRTLERLVEDLRTLTLAETGSLQLRRERVDLALLAADVASALQPPDRSVLVSSTVPDLEPVDADPTRLRSVLSNLVANSLRHTPRGGRITIGGRPAGGGVELTVADTGPGFPPDLLPHVFERFARGTGSRGSGLGLAIARDLVAAHGGTISAANAPGGGAVVTVRLPAAPA